MLGPCWRLLGPMAGTLPTPAPDKEQPWEGSLDSRTRENQKERGRCGGMGLPAAALRPPPPKVALGNGCPSAGGTCPPWPRPRDLGGEVKPEGSRGEEARREGKERGRGSQGVRDGRAHPQTHLPRGAGKRGRWLSSSVAALAQRSPALPCGDRGPEEPEKSPEG